MLPACGTPARRSQIRTASVTRVSARQHFLPAGLHAGRMWTWWMAPTVPVESSGLIACVFSAALLEAIVPTDPPPPGRCDAVLVIVTQQFPRSTQGR